MRPRSRRPAGRAVAAALVAVGLVFAVVAVIRADRSPGALSRALRHATDHSSHDRGGVTPAQPSCRQVEVVPRGPYSRLCNTYTFSGASLDDMDWSVYNSDFTASPAPQSRNPDLVTVSDNLLRVGQSGNTGSGLCLCHAASRVNKPYGRWEIRAKANRGSSPGFAILLWPLSGKWPVDGEIDVAEYNSLRTRLMQTVHFGSTDSTRMTFHYGDFTQWHTYGIIWSARSIVWTVDGRPTMTVTDRFAIPDKPMFLALQAEPDKSPKSSVQSSLDVRWVKTYQ